MSRVEMIFFSLYDNHASVHEYHSFFKTHKLNINFMNAMLFVFAYENMPELFELFCSYGAQPTPTLREWQLKNC